MQTKNILLFSTAGKNAKVNVYFQNGTFWLTQKAMAEDLRQMIAILPKRYVVRYSNKLNQAAGKSIFHVHIHLIPRYNGDVENPRGGVRGVIPGKRSY